MSSRMGLGRSMGNDHVKQQGPASGGVLELNRADAEQLAGRADQGCPAPEWMARSREYRFVQEVLPTASNSWLGNDAGCYRVVARPICAISTCSASARFADG